MSDNFPQYHNEKHVPWKHGSVQTFPDLCQCTSLSLLTLVTEKPLQKYDYKLLVWRIVLYGILNHMFEINIQTQNKKNRKHISLNTLIVMEIQPFRQVVWFSHITLQHEDCPLLKMKRKREEKKKKTQDSKLVYKM